MRGTRPTRQKVFPHPTVGAPSASNSPSAGWINCVTSWLRIFPALWASLFLCSGELCKIRLGSAAAAACHPGAKMAQIISATFLPTNKCAAFLPTLCLQIGDGGSSERRSRKFQIRDRSMLDYICKLLQVYTKRQRKFIWNSLSLISDWRILYILGGHSSYSYWSWANALPLMMLHPRRENYLDYGICTLLPWLPCQSFASCLEINRIISFTHAIPSDSLLAPFASLHQIRQRIASE